METSTVLLTVISCIFSVLLTVPYGSNAASSTLGPDALDCHGDYAFERKSGRNANGAERYNSGNTLARCKTRCSSVSSCRSFDWNFVNNECWIHSSNVENSLNTVTGVDHYLRIDCPESSTVGTTGLPPTIPDCINNYRYEEYPDKYVIGGTKHAASNTVVKCLTYCSGRSTTQCTAVDFNVDNNECWVHTTDADDLVRQTASPAGSVTNYVRKPCVEPTEGAIPNCVDDSHYEAYPDRYAIGGTKRTASNTVIKCLEYCSTRARSGSNGCTGVDFNREENSCWIHHTDADDLDVRTDDSGAVTHYVRETCDSSASTAPIPSCVDDSAYEDFPDKYALGGTKHSASNTLIKCLKYCSSRARSGSSGCTAVDFNDDNECWYHKTDADDLDLRTADEGTVTHYERERCDGSSTTPLTPGTTIPQPNLRVEFTLLFTNDYESTIDDVDAFIDTMRDALCDEFGIRCSRILRPRTDADVYKVIKKENPGPEIGSIVVEGELAPGLSGETDTEKVMEDFEDEWDSFKPRLTSDNNGIRLTPDDASNYDGFDWKKIYPDDHDEKPDDEPLLKTEYWVLIGLGVLAVVITIVAVVVICCLRRNKTK